MMKTLRFALLSAVAMFSTAAMADTTVVGAEDNTTGWWTAFSDYYTIAPNKTLKLKFQNFTSKENNWNNWLIVVTTDANRPTEEVPVPEYAEYVALRADNYGWQGANNTAPETPNDWFTSLTSNYNWDTFLSDMDGSTVEMTVKRLNAAVTIHADITTTGGTKYFEEFVINCGDGTQNIRAFLTTEKGHLVIDNSATTIEDTEIPTAPTEGTVIGELDNTTGWWTAFSDSYKLAKNESVTFEFENYSNKQNNWNNFLVAATNDVERNADGYKEYFIMRADNYCWGTYGNSNPDDANYYAGYVFTNNYNWDTFKDDLDGATVKLTVSRNAAKITAHADVTTAGGVAYFEELNVDGCDDGEQTIRTFLTVEGGHLVLKSAETTGIANIMNDRVADGVRYNLAGQKVGADYKGVVIENGKKMMVK